MIFLIDLCDNVCNMVGRYKNDQQPVANQTHSASHCLISGVQEISAPFMIGIHENIDSNYKYYEWLPI